MKIIFFGPPGSGKGTQAKLLSKFLHIPHLSTGEILRDIMEEKNDFSNKLKKIMSSGDLVSDDILKKIISQKLLTNECLKGFVLDGYPRTVSQSIFLNNFFQKNNIDLNLIINFNLDFKIIKKRIINRSRIEKRTDDSVKVIENRLSKYSDETKPLLSLYLTQHPKIYFNINADQEIEKIQKDIENLIENGNF